MSDASRPAPRKLHCALFYIALVATWTPYSSALYVEPLRIPAAVRAGGNYTLQCRYVLQPNTTLYSIRWYRDDVEMVRYMPKETPPHLVHYKVMTDIEIDRNTLREGNVTLVNLNVAASGRYRCEASLDAPTFETYEQEANLTVIAMPKGKTHMDLAKGTLHGNEPIVANCSGPQVSHLVPDIVWYLDSHPIPNDGRFVTRVVYNDSAFDEYRRVRSMLHLPSQWLRSYIDRHRKYQLHSKEQYYVLQLKCASTLVGIYEDSDAFNVKIQKETTHHQHVTNAPAVYQRGGIGESAAKSFSSSSGGISSFVHVRLAADVSGCAAAVMMYILRILTLVCLS